MDVIQHIHLFALTQKHVASLAHMGSHEQALGFQSGLFREQGMSPALMVGKKPYHRRACFPAEYVCNQEHLIEPSPTYPLF